MASAVSGEVIDRIAVSVGNRVITRSDIEREIRAVAFQNGTTPDFSVQNRHAVAEKMIEQKLVQIELDNSRYPTPTAAEVTAALEEFKKTHFADPGTYEKALAAAGISERDLTDVLLWERMLLEFIEIRFETGIQVSDADIAAYAREHGLGAGAAEKVLTAERADQQMEQWLKDARRRTTVIIHEEALR